MSSQLLHDHGISNGIDYYGSFMGVQKKFRMNLVDDIDYLTQSEYFVENRGKLYEVEESENPFANFGSRNNKNKLLIHNDSEESIVLLDDVQEIETEGGEPVLEGLEEIIAEQEDCVYEKSSETYSSENTSNNSEVNYSDEEGEEGEEGEGEHEESSQWSDVESDEDVPPVKPKRLLAKK